jgi:histidinol dehydrogenase
MSKLSELKEDVDRLNNKIIKLELAIEQGEKALVEITNEVKAVFDNKIDLSEKGIEKLVRSLEQEAEESLELSEELLEKLNDEVTEAINELN